MRTFKKIYIEITNQCNLACDFCPQTQQPGRFMSRDLFLRILLQIQGHVRHVALHVLGEPLLHPELGSFLELCATYAYQVTLTTNGTLIDTAADNLLQQSAVRQINFSLHCAEANNQSFSTDEYLAKIFDFINRARKRTDLCISLRLWNQGTRDTEEKNRYLFQRITKYFPLHAGLEDQLVTRNAVRLDTHVFLNKAREFQWPDMEQPIIGTQGFCLGLRHQIAVLADGTVVPCCLDGGGEINLGNIEKVSFAEIVGSRRAKNLYEGFSRREAVEPLCRRCTYRLRFSRER